MRNHIHTLPAGGRRIYPAPILILYFSFFPAISCGKGHKEATQNTIAAAERKMPPPAAAVVSLPSPEPASTSQENECGGFAEKSSLPPVEASPTLPNLEGFSGIDPDLFPDGEKGLDAIVQASIETGDEAARTAARQEETLKGKTPLKARELSRALPDKISGWKASGKVTATEENHQGSILPLASRKFRREGNVVATMTIIDTLEISEIRVGYNMGLLLTKKFKSPRQKLITIEGVEGYITVRDEQQQKGQGAQSKGAVLIVGRFLVVVTVEGLADFEETYRLLSSAKIARMLDFNH